jgi:group I intron endonuclease
MNSNFNKNIPNKAGIYRIDDCVSNKFYIGSSINIKRRVTQHIYRFKRGDHSNPIMQAIWNKDFKRLSFSVLEIINSEEKKDLLKAEQKYLNMANVGKNKLCMNILIVANSHLGVKRRKESIEKLRKVHIGRKTSEETKLKQRLAKLGTKQSLETILKRTSNQKGRPCNRPKGIYMPTLRKFTSAQIQEIRKLKSEGLSYSKLQTIFPASIGVLQRIISKESYADVL